MEMSKWQKSMPSVRAEIHSHSTHSDGTYNPVELAKKFAEAGVKLWALTDHDTCAGVEEARAAAQEASISFLSGIEVSAFEERSIHVLGYGVSPQVLEDFSQRRLNARFERMKVMVRKLQDMGVVISWGDVEKHFGDGAVARPHLARAMVDVGAVKSAQEAFDRYIGADGPAYIETRWPTVTDAIDLIHEAGGAAVLAHPGRYHRDHLIEAWARHGLDGIETIHPTHKAADEERYQRMAEELELLTTGSNDYHGPDHDNGNSYGDLELPSKWVDALMTRIHYWSARP